MTDSFGASVADHIAYLKEEAGDKLFYDNKHPGSRPMDERNNSIGTKIGLAKRKPYADTCRASLPAEYNSNATNPGFGVLEVLPRNLWTG